MTFSHRPPIISEKETIATVPSLTPRHDAVAREIVDSALTVHKTLGPGLLESVYELCLAHELVTRGLEVLRQVPVPIRYRGADLESAFRLDLLVGKCVVVEVKASERILPLHESQLLTYLRFTSHPVGLLVNFNVRRIKDGIRRLILTSDQNIPSGSNFG